MPVDPQDPGTIIPCGSCGRTHGPGPCPGLPATDHPCPTCGYRQALEPRELAEGIAALECCRCGGLWLDAEVLDDLVERARDRATGLWREGAPRYRGAAEKSTAYRRCPRCRVVMTRRAFGRRCGVVVDICHDHGTWFDADEIGEALRWIQEGGEYRAAAIEQRDARDRSRRERYNQLMGEALRGTHAGPPGLDVAPPRFVGGSTISTVDPGPPTVGPGVELPPATPAATIQPQFTTSPSVRPHEGPGVLAALAATVAAAFHRPECEAPVAGAQPDGPPDKPRRTLLSDVLLFTQVGVLIVVADLVLMAANAFGMFIYYSGGSGSQPPPPFMIVSGIAFIFLGFPGYLTANPVLVPIVNFFVWGTGALVAARRFGRGAPRNGRMSERVLFIRAGVLVLTFDLLLFVTTVALMTGAAPFDDHAQAIGPTVFVLLLVFWFPGSLFSGGAVAVLATFCFWGAAAVAIRRLFRR